MTSAKAHHLSMIILCDLNFSSQTRDKHIVFIAPLPNSSSSHPGAVAARSVTHKTCWKESVSLKRGE